MIINKKIFKILFFIPLLISCKKGEDEIFCQCPPYVYRESFPNLGDKFFTYFDELRMENENYILRQKNKYSKIYCDPCLGNEPYDKIVFYKVRPLLNNENVLNINIEYSLYMKKMRNIGVYMEGMKIIDLIYMI